MKSKLLKYIGPGPLVAAAFIGPGTVTVCTLAGVKFGYTLLWALMLSIIATIVLQEMAARIGITTQKGLPEVIKETIKNPIVKTLAIGLIILAIVFGNAAYQAGNISGAVIGIKAFGSINLFENFTPYTLLTGLIAWALLMSGNYKRVQQIMVAIVIVMSSVFMVTAIMSKPKLNELLNGFTPMANSDNIMTIVALIGTTVVPYNLFMHAALVSKKWHSTEQIKYARVDTLIAVILGGLVSMAIVVTGALGQAKDVQNVLDLAKSLEPILGSIATYFIGSGLFAAGITSAITAPLAGALVICGCFGWDNNLNSKPMRIAFSTILFLGVLFASLGIKPVQLITLAQLANGILLPFLSTFIIWLINKKSLMGKYTNNWIWNIVSIGIWVITWVLGIKSIIKVFEVWSS